MMLKDKVGKELPPEYERAYWAAADGDFHALHRALQNGIPINFINPVTTDSPLMIACRKGHAQVVRLCLDYGAKNDPHPEFGQTALHAAVTSNQYDCAKILLDIAAASEADFIIANLTDQHSQTPLHSAVTLGSVDISELLLQHGAKISAVDAYGQTPLHICSGTSSAECLAVLLDHGGDEYMETVDIYGNTPLHHAAYNGNVNCVKLLLETAANVSARNAKNLTAYNLATMQGHHQIGLLLLEYKDAARPADRSATSSTYPPKNNRPTAFSPTEPYSNLSTPSHSRVDESEFRTPMAYPEKKSLKKTFSMDPVDMVGMSLPRPHTVGSPSINLKNGQIKRQTSVSSASSPVDVIRKNSEGLLTASFNASSYNSNQLRPLSARSIPDDNSSTRSSEGIGDDNSETYRNLTQLSTPLLSRESSNQYSNGADKLTPREMSNSYRSSMNNNSKGNNLPNNRSSTTSSNYNTNPVVPVNSSQQPLDYTYMTAQNQKRDLLVNNYFSSHPTREDHKSQQSFNRNSNTLSYEYSQTYSSESIDNYELNQYSNDPVILSTPNRKQQQSQAQSNYYVSTEGIESEYVDPLEVFDCLDRTWHVYLTEDQHVYYLDMENSHSQWEDPRVYGIITQENYSDLPPESPSKLSDGNPPPLSPAFRSPSAMKISPKSEVKEEQIIVTLKEKPKQLSMTSFATNEDDEDLVSVDIGESLITVTTGESFSVGSVSYRNKSKLRSNNTSKRGNHSPSSSPGSSSSEEELSMVSEVKIRNISRSKNQRTKEALTDESRPDSEAASKKTNIFSFDEKSIEQSYSPTRNFRAIRSFEVRKNSGVTSSPNGKDELRASDSAVTDKLRGDAVPMIKSIKEKEGEKKRRNSDIHFDPDSVIKSTSSDDSNLKQFLHKRKNMLNEQEDHSIPFPFPKKNLNEVMEKVIGSAPSPNKENKANKANGSSLSSEIDQENSTVEEESFDCDRDHFIQLIVKKEHTPQEVRLLLERQGKSNAFILEILSSADEQLLSTQSLDQDDDDQDDARKKTVPVEDSEETKQTKINENLNKLVANPTNKPIYEKYVKMFKLGVLPPNILMKMNIDGLDKKYVKEFETALLLSKQTSASAAGVKESSKDILLMKDWNSINNHDRLKNSIWAFSTTRSTATVVAGKSNKSPTNAGNSEKDEKEKDDGLLAEKELKELEELFFQQQKTSNGNRTSTEGSVEDNATEKRKKVLSALEKTSKQPTALKILEGKRAQNIIIGLVPFKSIGNQLDIIKAICALNTLDDQLTIDHLENFQYLLPTESELKLSHQLKQLQSKDIQHPAEVFLQAVIFFYPELPIRLKILVICLSLQSSIQILDKRMKVMMNMINQVVSSPKLAKILQKLLIIGRVMIMESNSSSHNSLLKSKLHPNKSNSSSSSSSNGKMTILEQLILISNMKGIDKKTSVMDYVIKSLYDKNEQDLLGVLDDLSLITNSMYQENTMNPSSSSTMNSHQVNSQNASATASTSIPHQFASVEIFQEYNVIQKQFQQLTAEYERNTQQADAIVDPLNQATSSSSSSAGDIFASPTAKRISNEYMSNLENYICEFREQINLVMKKKLLLNKKLAQLIDYFGEERSHYLIPLPETSASSNSSGVGSKIGNNTGSVVTVYDVSNIFVALKDFSKSLAFSKESYEWKVSRK